MIISKLLNFLFQKLIVKIPIAYSLYNFFFRWVFYNVPKKLYFGFCPLCAKKTVMLIEYENLRETGFCLYCSATSRYKGVAEIIKRLIILKLHFKELDINTLKNLLGKVELTQYPLKKLIKRTKLKDFHIYEPSSTGAIYYALKKSPYFVKSEYFPYPNLKPGQYIGDTRFEDIQSLSFDDNSFDLIITLDVFEHIKDPELAFSEIYRVLKPDGIHIFTVPFEGRKKTIKRIDKNNKILITPVIYHEDDIRARGPIVYNDFGYDLVEKLNNMNIPSFIFTFRNPKLGIMKDIEILISLKTN